MARKLDKEQQADLTAYVNRLAELAGYESHAEWARDSGYPASNLSVLRGGKGSVDGYNLLRLIRAAAQRVERDPLRLAVEADAAADASRDMIARRLRSLEAKLDGGQEAMAESLAKLASAIDDLSAQIHEEEPGSRRTKARRTP